MSTFDSASAHDSTALMTPVPIVMPAGQDRHPMRSDEPPRGSAPADCDRPVDAPVDQPLAGSVAWLLVLTAGQKLLGFVRNVLVCRWLDAFHVGLWGMAQSAMDISVPLLMLSIPGSFGRYMEFYRQRGQLRAFLRWMSILCVATFVGGMGICFLLQPSITRLVFGDTQYGYLTAIALLAVVPAALFAFCIEFLLGARQGKTVSWGHFLRGTLFTCMTVTFLLAYRQDVTMLIAAYGLSFLVAVILLIRPVMNLLNRYPADTVPLALGGTVRRIAPAVFGCWAMDFLNNLFLTVDRYMLLHWSRTSNAQTLAAIGNYEAALLFPLLLATVAFMAARLLLPHLAKDWELGNRTRVVHSMNRAVQSMALVLVACGGILQLLAPYLFQIALRGQFTEGQEILPLAVMFYIWMALSWVVMNYLWCVERTAWGALAVVVGLVVNVILNSIWVPSAGIVGAAQATMVANAVQLFLLLGLTALFGMRWSMATLAACALPLALTWGPIASVPAILWGAVTCRQVVFSTSRAR